jgi:hypothetical protein
MARPEGCGPKKRSNRSNNCVWALGGILIKPQARLRVVSHSPV